jgi:hypothetical protein
VQDKALAKEPYKRHTNSTEPALKTIHVLYNDTYRYLEKTYKYVHIQKEYKMQKGRLDVRISTALRHQLEAKAQQSESSLTKLTERYLVEGLARDNGELIEQSSLPAVREAVRSEFNVCMDHLYERLSQDLQKSARKSDDRLAALIVKAARSAGIAQRMLFSLASKLVNYEFAMKIWDSAKEQTGKALIKPEESDPSR